MRNNTHLLKISWQICVRKLCCHSKVQEQLRKERENARTGVGGFSILYTVLGERLCEEVTFEQRPKEVRE